MSTQTISAAKFGRIPDAAARCGLSRSALYELAEKHRGLFRKYGSATIVDFGLLDRILADLPPADIGANTLSDGETSP
jgi:hypothetical protein